MFGDKPSRYPQRIGFFLLPRFPLMGVSAAVESLRAANRLSGRDLYSWHVLSKDGEPITATSGMGMIPDFPMDQAIDLSTVFVCGGFEAESYDDRQVLAWLRGLARRGIVLGGISTGSYVLARAGLLDGHRCTIHWEYHRGFAEKFANIEVDGGLFVIDRDRVTCSGGTAAMDMMLWMVAKQHGRTLATAVAEQFIHGRIRDGREPQRMALRSRYGISHPKLLGIIGLMEENVEDPLSRADLAAHAGVSTRQLERLFHRYLDRTPTRFYLELRLDRARQLLIQTPMSVLDVALACGFVSASHFSKCYRGLFGKTPRDERQSDD